MHLFLFFLGLDHCLGKVGEVYNVWLCGRHEETVETFLIIRRLTQCWSVSFELLRSSLMEDGTWSLLYLIRVLMAFLFLPSLLLLWFLWTEKVIIIDYSPIGKFFIGDNLIHCLLGLKVLRDKDQLAHCWALLEGV